MHARALVTTTLLAMTIASSAAAQTRHHDAFESQAEGMRIGLTTDIWATGNVVAAAMGVTAQVEVTPHFMLDFDVPWAVAGPTDSSLGDPRAVFGNITLGGHGFFKIDRNAALYGGLGISVPTRYNFDYASPDVVATMIAGASTRGLYDLHRLYPGTLFIRVPLGAEVHFAKYFYYRGALTPSILVNVLEGAPDRGPYVLLEHADEIEGRAPFGLGGGLRFQAVFALTDLSSGFGAADRAQVAMEPFVGYEPRGAGFYARLGLLMPVDGPFGPAFDKGHLRTVRISLGGKF
ncbi:Hypothetical protein A7982_01866 [Minicystis rosea]|nr:Hypothetical protein A7982_01866 [Minicystis rosea]